MGLIWVNFEVGIPILGHQFSVPKFRTESQLRKKSQEILCLNSIILSHPIKRNLHRAMGSGATALDILFDGLTTTVNFQYQRRKIDLGGYHRSNYFAR